MISGTLQALALRLPPWLLPRGGAGPGPVMLTQGRIYVLPSGAGLLYALTLVLLLVGSINYALGLGFVLTFLLGSMGLVAILHTWRNLAYLSVTALPVTPVYAGQVAEFRLRVTNARHQPRYTIRFQRKDLPVRVVDIPAAGETTVTLEIPAPRRGQLALGRISISSRYPLGLIHAWSRLDLERHCIVYPRPARHGGFQPRGSDGDGDSSHLNPGDEDFAGLRDHRDGDSPRHIAWKAAAREQGLLTKQFGAPAGSEVWLDWQDFPGVDPEGRLSRLTRAAMDASARGLAIGLRMPGYTAAPGVGPGHLHAILTMLAVHEC